MCNGEAESRRPRLDEPPGEFRRRAELNCEPWNVAAACEKALELSKNGAAPNKQCI